MTANTNFLNATIETTFSMKTRNFQTRLSISKLKKKKRWRNMDEARAINKIEASWHQEKELQYWKKIALEEWRWKETIDRSSAFKSFFGS